MKKQAKKLVLAKETLRSLELFEVKNGVGGLSDACSIACTRECRYRMLLWHRHRPQLWWPR